MRKDILYIEHNGIFDKKFLNKTLEFDDFKCSCYEIILFIVFFFTNTLNISYFTLLHLNRFEMMISN